MYDVVHRLHDFFRRLRFSAWTAFGAVVFIMMPARFFNVVTCLVIVLILYTVNYIQKVRTATLMYSCSLLMKMNIILASS